MRNLGKTLLYLFIFGLVIVNAQASAQDSAGGRPRTPIAATVPIFEVSAGYAYISLNMPSASRVSLNGADGNVVVNFTPRWGATVDSSYSRVGNVLSTGHGGSVLVLMAGPVFYPAERGNARLFVHALAGGGRVDSAVPTGATTFLGGQVTRVSFALGAGVEYDLSRAFGIRGGADYLRTTFVDAADKDQPQNNLRAVVGIVFKLGSR
jgi:hypothetical protein